MIRLSICLLIVSLVAAPSSWAAPDNSAQRSLWLNDLPEQVRSLLDAIQTSYGPIPNLADKIASLNSLSAGDVRAQVKSDLILLSDAQLYRFLDQIAGPFSYQRDAYDKFLHTYTMFADTVRALRQCPNLSLILSGNRSPSMHLGNIHVPLRKLLQAEGLLTAADIQTFHSWTETELIAKFVDADRTAMLTDADFLKEMIDIRMRLNLITVLVGADLSPEQLEPVLPLYHGFWPDKDQVNPDYAFNWYFIDDVRRLNAAGSATSLERFWALPSVRGYYQTFVDDRDSSLWRTLTPERFNRLQEVKFPFMSEMLSADGIHNMFRHAVLRTHLTMIRFLFEESNHSIHHLLPFPIQMDINEPFEGKSLAQRLTWSTFARNDDYRDLLHRILDAAPESLWRQTSRRILNQELSIDNLAGLKQMLLDQIRQAIPDFQAAPEPRPTWSQMSTLAKSMLNPLIALVQPKVTDCRLEAGSPALVIDEAFGHERDALQAALRTPDPASGNTLLHLAIFKGSNTMFDRLMALASSTDLTHRNHAGQTAFDFLYRFVSDRQRYDFDVIFFVEEVIRNMERIEDAFRTPASGSPHQDDDSSEPMSALDDNVAELH